MELTDNLVKHGAGHNSHPGYCLISLLESETNNSRVSILKMFFWVFPRSQFVVGRRFGTLYRFHLQRLVVDCGV